MRREPTTIVGTVFWPSLAIALMTGVALGYPLTKTATTSFNQIKAESIKVVAAPKGNRVVRHKVFHGHLAKLIKLGIGKAATEIKNRVLGYGGLVGIGCATHTGYGLNVACNWATPSVAKTTPVAVQKIKNTPPPPVPKAVKVAVAKAPSTAAAQPPKAVVQTVSTVPEPKAAPVQSKHNQNNHCITPLCDDWELFR
jgi:hypothetical protein